MSWTGLDDGAVVRSLSVRRVSREAFPSRLLKPENAETVVKPDFANLTATVEGRHQAL